MSFFSKLFGSKKNEEEIIPVKTTVRFDELGSWFNKETSGILEPVTQSTKIFFEELKAVSGELNVSIGRLECAKIEKEPEERVKLFAIDNRKALVKKVRAFNSKIKFPDAKNLPETARFHSEIGLELNNLIKDTAKNTHFTNMLFTEEVKDFGNSLRKLGVVLGKSQKALHENKQKIDSIFETEDKMQEIKGLMDAQKNGEEKLKSAKATMKKMHAREKELQKELGALNESDELAQLKQIREQKQKMDDERAFVEARVLQMFSPLGKAMKKYERYSTGLDREGAKILAFYMESPLNALLADKKQKVLGTILDSMEMLITAGRIDLKGKQKEKTVSQIALLKKSGELSSHIANYETIQKKISELDNKIKGTEITEKIGSTKDALSDIKNKIEDENQKILKLKHIIENNEQNTTQKIKELEPLLSRISDKDVSVEYIS